MIIRAAGKCNLQSTSRQNDPLFCLVISRRGYLCHQVFLFYFEYIHTFKWSTSLLMFWHFLSFACSQFTLPFGVHLSTCIQLPVGASDRWLVRCCVLSIIAATRAVSDYSSLPPPSPVSGWFGTPHGSDAHPLRICLGWDRWREHYNSRGERKSGFGLKA